jgi:hypothetical protein
LIEDFISEKVKDIFGHENKYILYDFTNTHFEGGAALFPKQNMAGTNKSITIFPQVTMVLLTDCNSLPTKLSRGFGYICVSHSGNGVLIEKVDVDYQLLVIMNLM